MRDQARYKAGDQLVVVVDIVKHNLRRLLNNQNYFDYGLRLDSETNHETLRNRGCIAYHDYVRTGRRIR